MDEKDPRRHHYLEEAAPPEIGAFIDDRVAGVYAERSQGGAGGYLTCLGTAVAWLKEFSAAGIPAELLGRQLDNRTWLEGGGYLRPGEADPSDHQWLAVGYGLWLFDPTASQFAEYGPTDLRRYIAPDGRPFPEWRSDRLRASAGRP